MHVAQYKAQDIKHYELKKKNHELLEHELGSEDLRVIMLKRLDVPARRGPGWRR